MTAQANQALVVDRAVSFAGHRVIRDGNAVSAVRDAFNEAVRRCIAENRTPAMVEVRLFVLPKEGA